ncbi:hypothetical protein GCM10020295_81720 [Streptomyces cinereospinus]
MTVTGVVRVHALVGVPCVLVRGRVRVMSGVVHCSRLFLASFSVGPPTPHSNHIPLGGIWRESFLRLICFRLIDGFSRTVGCGNQSASRVKWAGTAPTKGVRGPAAEPGCPQVLSGGCAGPSG